MKNRIARRLFCLIAVVPTLAHAGALDASRVPAPSAWIVHLDVDRLKASEIGRLLLEQSQQADAERQLAEAQSVFNFDPRKDLKSLTVCGTGVTEDSIVLMAEGAFDAARLATLAGGEAGYAVTAHGEDQIHQWLERQQNQTLYAAFPAEGRLLVGPGLEALKGALDTWRGRAPALGAAAARPANNLPMLNAAVIFSRLPADAEMPPFLQGARTGRFSVSEQAGDLSLDLVLDFDQAERAEELRSMAAGLIAMAAMNAQDNPELADLAQRLRITSEGSAVRAQFRITAVQLRDAIQKMWATATPAGGVEAPGGDADAKDASLSAPAQDQLRALDKDGTTEAPPSDF